MTRYSKYSLSDEYLVYCYNTTLGKKVFTEIHSGIYWLFVYFDVISNIYHRTSKEYFQSQTAPPLWNGCCGGWPHSDPPDAPSPSPGTTFCRARVCSAIPCFSLSWPPPWFCWRMSSSSLLRKAARVVNFCRVCLETSLFHPPNAWLRVWARTQFPLHQKALLHWIPESMVTAEVTGATVSPNPLYKPWIFFFGIVILSFSLVSCSFTTPWFGPFSKQLSH